jgi:hypothetical protein
VDPTVLVTMDTKAIAVVDQCCRTEMVFRERTQAHSMARFR